eukprot:2839906-Rhodomonas_salina.1
MLISAGGGGGNGLSGPRSDSSGLFPTPTSVAHSKLSGKFQVDAALQQSENSRVAAPDRSLMPMLNL